MYWHIGANNAWWRHQMEAFSALLTLCMGNSLVTGEFAQQIPVTRNFDVFFDLCLNKRLSKQSWGWWFETPLCSLWYHFNGHMTCSPMSLCCSIKWTRNLTWNVNSMHFSGLCSPWTKRLWAFTTKAVRTLTVKILQSTTVRKHLHLNQPSKFCFKGYALYCIVLEMMMLYPSTARISIQCCFLHACSLAALNNRFLLRCIFYNG